MTVVLYSRQADAWKIADFGLTSEGTSKKYQATVYSRGTACYRSPELVRRLGFNNKADIWALGCVIYELVFRGRMFTSDIDVHEHADRYQSPDSAIEIPSTS